MADQDIHRASIQHFPRPGGTDAVWLADHYFGWLDGAAMPIARARRTADGAQLHVIPVGAPAIELRETVSTAERVVFVVCGGWLVDGPDGGTFEFRIADDGGFEIALREFAPALPRLIYVLTQSIVHELVMWVFARHVRSLDRPLLAEESDNTGGT